MAQRHRVRAMPHRNHTDPAHRFERHLRDVGRDGRARGERPTTAPYPHRLVGCIPVEGPAPGGSGPDAVERPRGRLCVARAEYLRDGGAIRCGDLEAVVPRLTGRLPFLQDPAHPVTASPTGEARRTAGGRDLRGNGFIDQHGTTRYPNMCSRVSRHADLASGRDDWTHRKRQMSGRAACHTIPPDGRRQQFTGTTTRVAAAPPRHRACITTAREVSARRSDSSAARPTRVPNVWCERHAPGTSAAPWMRMPLHGGHLGSERRTSGAHPCIRSERCASRERCRSGAIAARRGRRTSGVSVLRRVRVAHLSAVRLHHHRSGGKRRRSGASAAGWVSAAPLV